MLLRMLRTPFARTGTDAVRQFGWAYARTHEPITGDPSSSFPNVIVILSCLLPCKMGKVAALSHRSVFFFSFVCSHEFNGLNTKGALLLGLFAVVLQFRHPLGFGSSDQRFLSDGSCSHVEMTTPHYRRPNPRSTPP